MDKQKEPSIAEIYERLDDIDRRLKAVEGKINPPAERLAQSLHRAFTSTLNKNCWLK